MKQKLTNSCKRALQIALVLVIFLTTFQKTNAQPPINPIHEIDSQLRVIFSPICRPTPSPNFLYEMAVRTLDSIYYTDNNPDTIQRDAWYKIYEEMRNSAYDTTVLVTHDSIYNKSVDFYPDTVVMDMLAYNYLAFNDSALSCDFYFDFDTITNEITEKGAPCELNPFVIKRVFASSPVLYTLPYKQVTFRIDSNFIYHDEWNSLADSNWDIKINFGDGAGWHTYSPNVVSHYAASYSTSGEKYITTYITAAGSPTPIMSSIAEVWVPEDPKPEDPQQKITFTDVNVGIYEPCSESGEPLKKVIIVVPGYDPADVLVFGKLGARTIGDIYYQMIKSNNLDYLRNFGYTFAVVDWNNSRIDMRLNAAALEEVIDYFKCQQVTVADTGTHEQFVIIAESMGGLVARYAMCDMEQNWLLHSMGGCLPEKMHNTRLLLTFDSPHKGVNIPLALQHTFRDVGKFILGTNSITQAITGGMTNLYLDGTSVKQMLLYHVDTRNPITHEYTEHPDKTSFDADLAALGNYPQYCKLFAMSNGNISGNGQSRVYDGAVRSPNDYLLHYTTDIYGKWKDDEFKLYGTDIALKTTPNGSGDLASLRTDYYRPVISTFIKVTPRWPWPPKIFIKISISSAYFTSLTFNHHGNNIEPYDVIPGSTEDMNSIFTGKKNSYGGNGVSALANNLFFGFKTPTYNSTTHTYTTQKTAGTGGLWGNLYASVYSDGMNFCFVPTFSALDYSLPSNNYWHDIEGEAIGTKTSATPFHVITGIIKDDLVHSTFPYRFSQLHVHARNEALGSYFNDTLRVDTGIYRYQRYDSCVGTPNPPVIRFLNREIGDDRLLVENRVTDWTCIYDAEKYIGVNEHSLYYQYPTTTGSTNIIPGIYSKEDPFVINSGTTYFKSRHANVVVVGTLSGSYVIDSINWIKCCNNYGSKSGVTSEQPPQPHSTIIAREAGSFTIVPNPVTDNDMILIFPSMKDEHSKVMIFDIMGRKLIEKDFSNLQEGGENRYRLNFDKGLLVSGTYFVVLKNGKQNFRKAIVIK